MKQGGNTELHVPLYWIKPRHRLESLTSLPVFYVITEIWYKPRHSISNHRALKCEWNRLPQCQTPHFRTTTIGLLAFKPSLCSVFKCHTCWRECELLPSLYVERGEGLESGLARKQLEAALRVLDASHTEEPHEEVKAIHEECTEHRSLWRETPQWLPKCWIDIFYSALSWKHSYLSYRSFLQVSSGTAGNCHVVLIT